jgi:hypothetical protein
MLRYSNTYPRNKLLEYNEIVCNVVRKGPKLLDAPVVNSPASKVILQHEMNVLVG